MYNSPAVFFFYFYTMLFSNSSLFTSFSLPVPSVSSTYTSTSTSLVPTAFPIVLLHGIATNADNIQNMSEWLEYNFQRPVFNIEIGNGIKTSIYTPVSLQMKELCETIYTIDELKNGFDFIGISQGGLLARGYVERCNAYPVRNLITLVSPHGGTIIKNIAVNMYSDFYQEHFSASNYWRDPRLLAEYLIKCSYLPLLNNEIIEETEKDEIVIDYNTDNEIFISNDRNEDDMANTQRDNIKSLKKFVLVWSPNDKIVNPPQSAKFSFYDEKFDVIPLEETDLYKTDALGLKYLDNNDKLFIHQTSCAHEDHGSADCFDELYPILKLYL